MNYQKIRTFLLMLLTLISVMLFLKWQNTHIAKVNSETEINASSLPNNNKTQKQIIDVDIPEFKPDVDESKSDNNLSGHNQSHELLYSKSNLIFVDTDVFKIAIDKKGGDIVSAKLPEFSQDGTNVEGFILLDNSDNRFYIAQSGLTSDLGPDSPKLGRANYSSEHTDYSMQQNSDLLIVNLHYITTNGINVNKRFTFKRGKYDIDVEYLIHNNTNHEYIGKMYGRLKRNPPVESGSAFLGVQTFTGMAINTKEKPYTKLTFKEITEKALTRSNAGGWIAMIEHYFVSAWIPSIDVNNSYHAKSFEKSTVGIEFLSPNVKVSPNDTGVVKATLYLGPQVSENLKALSPGLELTVDYGILWPVCQPIFWLLKKIHDVIGNWGLAIIFTTLVIKLLFYKLSASSYKSMGQMRKLQPRIQLLKEKHGEDKQKFGQAVMEMYRNEKINPLGGCLPMVVQIPVFIALYYVLLGSVELHHAAFYGWIQDLSAKDPFYILPLLMGASMFIQQRLSPAPSDPVQAKVMMFMPIVFTALFLQFPSGLVLYWLVNNVLSILQQWAITRSISKDTIRYVK